MLNKVMLMGRLTREVEVKEVDGHKVVNNTLAVGRDGKDAGTDFIDIAVWNESAENMAKRCSKGSLIVVEARWRADKFTDKEGKSRKSDRANIDRWYAVEKKGDSDAQGAAPAAPADPVADAGGVQFPW